MGTPLIPPSGVLSVNGKFCTGMRLFCAVLAVCMIASSCSQPSLTDAVPLGSNGILDARTWDFSRQGSLKLDGDWHFYPGTFYESVSHIAETGKFRPVPDRWSDTEAGGTGGEGAATYMLEVLLPAGHGELAIRIPTISTSFTMFVDGRRIASAGTPSVDPAVAVSGFKPGVAAIPMVGERIEIVVHVSNHVYRNGGMWRSLTIGHHDALLSEKRTADISAIVFFAFISATAFHSLFLFLFRRSEKSHLRFALFALVVAVRPLVTGEYLLVEIAPWIGFDTLIRIEYLSAFLPLPSALLFFLSIFSGIVGRAGKLLLLLPSVPFLALTFVAPLQVLTRSIYVYYPVALVLLAASFIFVLGRSVVLRKPGSPTIFAGAVILAAAGINDMLYSSFLIMTGNMLAIGLTIFVLLQSLVLAQRFTEAFVRSEGLSAELARANSRLEEEVHRYQETHKRLEALVSEKETLLVEVHHRVKNSLQIVSSMISLQSYRVSDPEVLAAYQSMKARIRAISLVHEKLYSLGSPEKVDLGTYGRDLVRLLASGYNAENGYANVNVDSDRIEVPVDFCVDVGLILTEVVANAFKHAILPQGGGMVQVTIHLREGDVVVKVADDGPGFEPGFDVSSLDSLGFRIINSLLQRRDGSFGINQGPGGEVTIRIPLNT